MQLTSNLLLTGASGVGKSTLLKNLAPRLTHRSIRGAFSQAIYQGRERIGWHLENFEGKGGLVAHQDIDSAHCMGPYGVDMDLFHQIMAPQLRIDPDVDVYLIDEIGIIASWSPRFMRLMDALLDSDRRVVSIIRQKSTAYVDRVKTRTDVELWEVTPENRDRIFHEVFNWIEKA